MQKQILVIEDEKQTLDTFLDCLDLEGFEAIGASNGTMGLQLAQQHLPSLIVCDIVMPEMDGYEVLLALKENPLTAIIPVIFLTAKGSRSDIRKGMQLGADDYISKPSTLRDFLDTVAIQIEKRSLLERCYEAKFQGESQDIAERDELSDEFEREGEFCTSEQTASTYRIFPEAGALKPVFDFIEANYQNPITLADVAQAIGYSPAYLTSQVGEQTGRTVNRWIIERRMVAARSLLKTSDRKIEQIAAIVGYQHACHFSRQFRKHHGLPPNAWRIAQLSEAENKQQVK